MNPHFLFNELKDISAALQDLRDPNAKLLVRRIEALESMAQYNAANVAEKRRVVVVERELEQLKRYLQARHQANSKYPQTILDIVGIPAGHKIVPMVLIFLAENAFTHGDLRTDPLMIRINLEPDVLHILFSNRVPAEKPDALSLGSGLVITRRRLELAMPGQFTLEAKDASGAYTVTLTIYQ